MDDRYNPMADCERGGREPLFAATRAAETLSNNVATYGLETRTVRGHIRRNHDTAKLGAVRPDSATLGR